MKVIYRSASLQAKVFMQLFSYVAMIVLMLALLNAVSLLRQAEYGVL